MSLGTRSSARRPEVRQVCGRLLAGRSEVARCMIILVPPAGRRPAYTIFGIPCTLRERCVRCCGWGRLAVCSTLYLCCLLQQLRLCGRLPLATVCGLLNHAKGMHLCSFAETRLRTNSRLLHLGDQDEPRLACMPYRPSPRCAINARPGAAGSAPCCDGGSR